MLCVGTNFILPLTTLACLQLVWYDWCPPCCWTLLNHTPVPTAGDLLSVFTNRSHKCLMTSHVMWSHSDHIKLQILHRSAPGLHIHSYLWQMIDRSRVYFPRDRPITPCSALIGWSASSLSLQLLSVCPVQKVYLFNYVPANLLKKSGISVHRGLLWSTPSVDPAHTPSERHTHIHCAGTKLNLCCVQGLWEINQLHYIFCLCLLTCERLSLLIPLLSFPLLLGGGERGLDRGWQNISQFKVNELSWGSQHIYVTSGSPASEGQLVQVQHLGLWSWSFTCEMIIIALRFYQNSDIFQTTMRILSLNCDHKKNSEGPKSETS